MENKYLVLKFRNAKLFRNKKDGSCKDYVNDINTKVGYRKRMDKQNNKFEEQFVEPITVYQVSNVIHTLFNERPVPSKRLSLYDKVDYLFEKAQNSFIKLTDTSFENEIVKTYNKNTGEYQFITEKIQVKKGVYNSWNPNPIINWEIIKQYLGSDENREWFFGNIIDLFNINPLEHDLEKVRLSLQVKNPKHIINGLKERNLTALANFITKNTKTEMIANNTRARLTVNTAIENVIILNGIILVPINDNDIEKLKISKGCATILDNGYLWIDSVKHDYELMTDGFTQLKNISTEKY
jgi:hypothetical protein